MSSARHNSDWQSIAQLSANQPFVLLIKNAHIVLPWETSNERKLPAMNYLFRVNNVNTKTTCENCSRLTIETLELRRNSSWLFYIIFQYYKNIVKIFAKIWLYTCYIEMLIECIQNPLGTLLFEMVIGLFLQPSWLAEGKKNEFWGITQLIFACTKSTVETLEKCAKYV